jgi:diacylglycerol kinase (ATP)
VTQESPFGPLEVLIDPTAGGGAVRGRIDDVREAVAASGLAHRVTVARSPDELIGLARGAVVEGRFLAVAGDDRSLRRVVTGLAAVETGGNAPVLALLPGGAPCDLAKSFGLPVDLPGAVAHLAGDNVYDLDLVKIQVARDGAPHVEYAANMAAVGFHAAAGEALAPERPGIRRFAGFWGAYLRTRTRDVQIRTDAKQRDLRAWSVIVGNGQFGQGGLRLSPRSFPGDGILDALVFTGPRSDAYRLLPRIFRHGDHVPDPGIVELKARLTFQVDADRPMPVVADGEAIGSTPVTFQLQPGAVRLKL